MHRHGYKGRKFGRESDQRTALTRGLMRSLFKYKSINTTLAKAKEIRRPAEKLVTIAKKGDLAARRLVIARLNDQETGNELIDVIAPQIKRDSGYLRIERTGFRKGDNAEMATISFVDEIKDKKAEAKEEKK
ncbi:50S ribosomal protein L17 [Candidatus Saccharibacteria bacterium]|nr:50S ribosomal protein L17 [Candidatus Saccharibacteria bacterium]